MNNVFAAIQNRDAGAMARMMGPDNHHDQQDNVVNISAERLVDALFKQLKQLFPAAEQTNLKTAQQETDAKRQWICGLFLSRFLLQFFHTVIEMHLQILHGHLRAGDVVHQGS